MADVVMNGEPATHATRAEQDSANLALRSEWQKAVVKLETERGTGSGFFIDDTGHVATAAHVVVNAKEIFAVTADSKRYRAKIEKLDDCGDIAELKIEDLDGTKHPFLKLADTSKSLKKDVNVFALGHPRGVDTVTLSPGTYERQSVLYDLVDKNLIANKFKDVPLSTRRDWLSALSKPVLQAAVRIEPGNSGGPLLDASGRVIGIASAVDKKSGDRAYFTSVDELEKLVHSPGKYSFRYDLEPSSNSSAFLEQLKNRTHGNGDFYSFMVGQLAEDLRALKGSTFHADKSKYGLAAALDTSILTSGALSVMPGMAFSSLLFQGVSIAARSSTDQIPHRLRLKEVVREDGDQRPLFKWSDITAAK